MRYLRPELRAAIAASLGAVVFLLGHAAGAQAPPDPVESIKQALVQPLFPTPEAIEYRKNALDKAIAELRTPSQLRRALELSEWTDAEYNSLAGGTEVSTVDRVARK